MKKFMMALIMLVIGVMSFANDLHLDYLEPEWDLIKETKNQLVYHNIQTDCRIIRSYTCPLSDEIIRFSTSNTDVIEVIIKPVNELDYYIKSYRYSDGSYITVIAYSKTALDYLVNTVIGG